MQLAKRDHSLVALFLPDRSSQAAARLPRACTSLIYDLVLRSTDPVIATAGNCGGQPV